ncbi:esterase-like activity of phytase family protein [Neisseria bacilliformis]|uniref:esterase-like activity of phytase family protein n=1 Tax=Neisseria bacilliformis TaxID=267212 RepID=UPI0028E7C2E9|nr:esterase-like activity of phytase family protein [Neisseria bacilliformis]
MKQTILAALAGLLLAHQALAETLPMPVEKLGEVQGVPFYKGYGSSIDADPQNPKRFYGLTDRGPNADGGEDIKIFLLPGFTPSIGHFEIQADGRIKKLRDIPLRDAHGKPLTGLPNPAGYGTSKETVVDANHQLLQRDKTGIDSEGLAVMRDGTFWVSDEYGPHIVHFDRNGIELERMSPRGVQTTGRRLPAVLGHLRPNRGMEGITTTPSNRVLVGIMQSALYNPSKQAVANKSVTRILSFDLATGKTKQYLYQQGGDFWKNSEIRALDEHRFLVDEHNGKDVKHAYLIDLNGATDVSDPADSATGLKVNGKTIEENSWEELVAAGIKPVRKTLVSDVKKDVDFQSSKFEGMWVADGGKTLWIINDDDFGIDSKDDHTIVPKRLPNGQTDATRLYRIPLNIK